MSNLDETVVGLHTVQTGASHAQEFTTGNTTGVYKLTKVTVNFTLVTNASRRHRGHPRQAVQRHARHDGARDPQRDPRQR